MASASKSFVAPAPFLVRIPDGDVVREEYRDSGAYPIPDKITLAEANRLASANCGAVVTDSAPVEEAAGA